MEYNESKTSSDVRNRVEQQILEMMSTLSSDELIRIYAYIKELYFS